MAKRTAKELYTILHEKGQPDPLILIDIAPFIPDYLIPRAIQVALGISYPDLHLRAATVESLASRLKMENSTLIEETLVAARRVLLDKGEIEPVLLQTLASVLPSYLIPEALELTIRIVNYNIRLDVLATLATYLPSTAQESILSSALDAINALQFEYEKKDALIILIKHLPQSIPLLKKTIRIATSLPEKELIIEVISALVYYFKGKDEFLKYINKIQKDYIHTKVVVDPESIYAISSLREIEPADNKILEEEDKRVLKSLFKLPDFYYNIKYLVGLVQKLPKKERVPLIPKILKTAHSIVSIKQRAYSLICIVSLIPQEERSVLFDEILSLIASVEEQKDKADLSALLIPFLPQSLREHMLPEIISLTSTLNDEVKKVVILENLIPVVPISLVSDIIDILDSFKNPRFKVETLIKLSAYFPTSLLHNEMTKALEAAITLKDAYERSYLIYIYAPCLLPDLLRKALSISHQIRKRYLRAEALSTTLASLARQTWGTEREEILREAIKEAFFISPPHGGRGGPSDPIRINVSGVIAKEVLTELPEDNRESILKEWLGSIEKIPETTNAEENASKEMTKVLLPSRKRVVNTGFSDIKEAGKSLKGMPLACGKLYYFWLDIGALDLYSIEKRPTPIPVEHLPSEAILKIALFNFENEIKVVRGEDVGELILQSDGTAKVNKQPLGNPDLLPVDLVDKRLYFPVIAPEKTGISKLRCNIYYEQILVQARLIQAQVMEQPIPEPNALSSVVDYTLSHTLWPAHLNRLSSHKLSLMLNSNGDKTHALLFGQKGDIMFKREAALSASELKTPIDNARKAMCKVSWGDTNPWAGQQYKYQDQKFDINRLSEDIFNLAISGYILYNAIIDKLTGGRKESYQLFDLMLNPGMVQIALKQSPSQVIPATIFYDYPLDTQASHKLCHAFVNALQKKEPLEETPCFNGACPTHDEVGYVCPSGFWGYRHFLGTPVSLCDQYYERDVPPEIVVKGKTEIVTGVATNLRQLNEHMKKIRSLSSNLGWHYSENRIEIINLLKNIKSHIIYFYCHGELGTNKTLFLQVGNGNEYIEGSILRANHILWDNPSPLVFINGCQTIAVDPEQAINLVQDFIGSGGSGVIGTEITIFESLACNFAEECLSRFLSGNSSIGAAVRNARLKILKEGNPLGLVYSSFVIPSLYLNI